MTNIYWAILGLIAMFFYLIYGVYTYYSEPLLNTVVQVEVVDANAPPFAVQIEWASDLEIECCWMSETWLGYPDGCYDPETADPFNDDTPYWNISYAFPESYAPGVIFDLYYVPVRDDLTNIPFGAPTCQFPNGDPEDGTVMGYMLDSKGNRLPEDPITFAFTFDEMMGMETGAIGWPAVITVSHFIPGPTLSDEEKWFSYTFTTEGGGGYMAETSTVRDFYEFTYEQNRSEGSLSTVLGGIFGIFNSIWAAVGLLASFTRPESDEEEDTKGKHQAVPMDAVPIDAVENEQIDSPPANEQPEEDIKDESPLLANDDTKDDDQHAIDSAPVPEDDLQPANPETGDEPEIEPTPESVPAATEESEPAATEESEAPEVPDEGEMDI